MRGKEKEGPPYFTLWWGVWKELLRTDLHINLSSVFPFFFFFCKAQLARATSLCPLATSQRHYPASSAHWLHSSLPPSNSSGLSHGHASPRPLFPLLTSKHLLLHLSLSFKGNCSDYSLISTLPPVFPRPLNQDSWAKNIKSGSSSALLREALVFSGGCASEGSRCINYPAHVWMSPLQSFVSPCV